MSVRKKHQNRDKFSLDLNGKTYQADYYVEGGMVTVEAMSEDAITVEKTTQIGASAEATARRLLKELISAGRVQESGC